VQERVLADKPTQGYLTMNQDNKLYTPEGSAVVFIEDQPQMKFGVAGTDRARHLIAKNS
jgi:hypothetical protein